MKVQNTIADSTLEVAEGTRDFCELGFNVEAFPNVNYDWMKDDIPVDIASMKIQQVVNKSSVYLCFMKVEKMHAGSYTIQASNQYQNESVTIELIVLGKLAGGSITLF